MITNSDFLFPPYPATVVGPNSLVGFERNGWYAQVKMDGICDVTVVQEGNYKSFTRNGTEHTKWKRNSSQIVPLLDVPGRGKYVFVSELLTHRIKGLEHDNIRYVHDVLVIDGHSLVGVTYQERYDILLGLFTDYIDAIPISHQTSTASLAVDDFVWLAKCNAHNFRELFETCKTIAHWEGLVLKDPNSRLAHSVRQDSNSSWLRKCRKPMVHCSS